MKNNNITGCQSESLSILSAEEVTKMILEGKELVNLEIDHLELTGTKIPSIYIDNCRIGNFNIEGCQVKETVFIKNTTFRENVIFSDKDSKEKIAQTRFGNHVRFENCIMEKDFICRQAQFVKEITFGVHCRGLAILDYSIFRNDAQFNSSVFSKNLSATECFFLGHAWFRDIYVNGNLIFRRNTFEKKLNLGRSRIGSHFFINNSSFGQRFGMNGFECGGEAVFDDSKFFNEFSCKGGKFAKRFSFHSCVVEGDAKFDECVFDKECSFKNAHTKGKFRATKAQFKKQVILDNARCEGAVILSSLVFEGDFFCRNSFLNSNKEEVNFSKTKFMREVDFTRTIFAATQIDFSGCEFMQKTSFRKTKLGTEGGLLNFSETNFANRIGFEESVFSARTFMDKSIFRKRAGFDSCVFYQATSFISCLFEQLATFQYAQFFKQTKFCGSEFAESEFLNVEFEGSVLFSLEQHVVEKLNEKENLEQKPCIFNGKSGFTNARFNKKAIFQKVEFKDEIRYNNAYFGEQVSFRRAKFYKDVLFSGIFCSLELDLRNICVEGELILKGANINRRLNLADAQFEGIAFYNMVTDIISISPEQIKNKLRGNRTDRREVTSVDILRTAQEYLIVKNSFSLQGMHEEEDWAYWQFRRISRRFQTLEAKKNKNILGLVKTGFEKVFIDYGSHYGTHPFRITLLAVLLIICFGCFYYIFSDQLILEGKEISEGDKPSIIQCIYFSVMAFTTMGFGDVHPNFHSWLKGFVALEALVGIITMTLFVGTYARKIVR